MSDAPAVAKGSLWAAAGSLLFASSTLVCCVLPAAMVALGAGAALAGLVSTFPQLIWLSMHKAWVFGLAGLALAAAGYAQWRARFEPCPADPALAVACARTRRWSAAIYWIAVAAYGTGVAFAFVLPRFLAE